MADTEETASRSQMWKHEDFVEWATEEGLLTAKSSQAETIAVFAANRNAYRKTARYRDMVEAHKGEAQEAAAARKAERAAAAAERKAAKEAAAKEKAAKAEKAPAKAPAKKAAAKATTKARSKATAASDENPFDD